jgi:DNA-damage-inducible protein J
LKILCVQVIVHDRETADGDGGDLREFLESVFDPLFTVSRSFTKQEGASYVAGHAVVPAGYGGVDQVRASHCHSSLRPVGTGPGKGSSAPMATGIPVPPRWIAGAPRMRYNWGGGKTVTKTDTIRARVEPKLKAEAESILDSLGMNPSDAIRVFYKQIVMRKGLPFDMVLPNAETRRAMEDVNRGRGLNRYRDAKELAKKLGT